MTDRQPDRRTNQPTDRSQTDMRVQREVTQPNQVLFNLQTEVKRKKIYFCTIMHAKINGRNKKIKERTDGTINFLIRF